MALEIERKYLGVDFAELSRALADAGAEDLGAHFESNAVYDTSDLNLWASRRLLRVRRQEWPGRTRYVLTLKLPVDAPEGAVKAREERELGVESAHAMGEVLEGLGYLVVARYEKVRTVWRVAGLAPMGREVLVQLDVLPFCHVVELEGEPEAIDAAAARLGLDKHEISTKSYHALHQEWRSAQGLPPERSFMFGPEEERRLRQQLGLSGEAGTCF